ncbi:hypothetical protein ACO1PF_08800 [Alkalibacterium sp. f15]|uniref:hypothetical protein n=1 Tax=Alkalibacterium sp. f15 TaxID=3414029 RepID=UPI003BF785A4
MIEKERKRREKILAKWVPFYIITCTFIGAVLGSLLIYFIQDEFPYEVLIAGVVVTIILTLFEVIKHKRKRGDLPEYDERLLRNVFRFFAYTSHISLAVLFVSLGIFTLLGIESISILYLWIGFFSYIWIVGIGTIIIKRR